MSIHELEAAAEAGRQFAMTAHSLGAKELHELGAELQIGMMVDSTQISFGKVKIALIRGMMNNSKEVHDGVY